MSGDEAIEEASLVKSAAMSDKPESTPGSPSRHNILMVGVGSSEFDRWAPVLARSDFEIDLVPTVASARELLEVVPFGLILVRYPLGQEPLERFLERIRRADGPSHEAPIVLLSEADDLDEARRFKDKGVQEVVPAGESAVRVYELICRLLNVAPRRAIRLLVRLDARLEGGKSLFVCQTENISATGMLISTDRRLPPGTEAKFELDLPNESVPVKGSARVVRETDPKREKVLGLGLHFASFRGDGERRLDDFLDARRR